MKKIILVISGVMLGLFLFTGYALARTNLTIKSNVNEHIYISIPVDQALELVPTDEIGETPLANTKPVNGVVATNEAPSSSQFTMYVNSLTLTDKNNSKRTMGIKLYICAEGEANYITCKDNGGEITDKQANKIKLSEIITVDKDHMKADFKIFAKSDNNAIEYFSGSYENLQMQLTYIID